MNRFVEGDRFAVLSDIHGNRWALEAVWEDLQLRNVKHVLNLGDSLYGPLDPAGTADLLMGLEIRSIRGNEDRILIDPEIDEKVAAASAMSLSFTRRSLGPLHFDWLQSLAATSIFENEVFCCHGSPRSDDEYLLHKVEEGGASPRGEAEILQLLEGIPQRLVLCGHDHLPGTAALADGRRVVNPGSVGLPAYLDDTPFPHAMAAGTPLTRYALVRVADGCWETEFISLAYDWVQAAQVAVRNGRPDWAQWIRTGRAAV